MTQEEKLNAIRNRAGEYGETMDPLHLSLMMVMGYMNALQELNLITTPFELPEKGKIFLSICEEFDWLPSDQEIDMFLKELVPGDIHTEIYGLICLYRDKREELLKKVNTQKKG